MDLLVPWSNFTQCKIHTERQKDNLDIAKACSRVYQMHEVFYKIDLYDNQNFDYFSMKPDAYFDDIANCSSQLINLRNCQIDMKIVVTLQNLSKPISLNAYFEYVKRI